uniref:SFRICE042065.2 n=1 Tax=Spodoptera frugiperda TaxID=7108 RepID=A0A2H1WVI1_SPOFR
MGTWCDWRRHPGQGLCCTSSILR